MFQFFNSTFLAISLAASRLVFAVNRLALAVYNFLNLALLRLGINPISLTTINANLDLDILFGGVADIIIKIAFYIGAVLSMGGVLSLIYAYKDENADAQGRAIRVIVAGGALVGLRTLFQMAGIIG